MNKALFKENIKRFWPVSAAAFIVYFMSGPFLLLTNQDNNIYDYVVIVKDHNLGFGFLQCLMPVAICSCVFQYLFKSSSTTVMHALPFTRKSLYVTTMASGLVLALAPAMLTGVIMMFIKVTGSSANMVNSFGVLNYAGVAADGIGPMLWLLAVTAVVITFSFAVCSFGAAISGNGIIALLTGCALNVLLPLLKLGHYAYQSTYYYGFDSINYGVDSLKYLHPFLYYIAGDYQLGVAEGGKGLLTVAASLAAYLAAAGVIAFAAYKVYGRRANEKTGDSYVFDTAGFIIGLLIVYIGTSMVGLIFEESFGIWGYILSGVVFFLVSQMIVKKTVKIFSISIVKPLIASVVMMALVIGIYIFDIFGIEERVPDVKDIKQGAISSYSLMEGYKFKLEDDDILRKLTGFQKMILSDRKQYKGWQGYRESAVVNSEDIETRWVYVDIEYELENGKMIRRSYNIPVRVLAESDQIRYIFDHDSQNDIYEMLYKADPSDTTFDLMYTGYEYSDKFRERFDKIEDFDGKVARLTSRDHGITTEQLTAVMQAVAADQQDMSYDDYMNNIYTAVWTVFFEIDLGHLSEEELAELKANESNFFWVREVKLENPASQYYRLYMNIQVFDETHVRTLDVIEDILRSM